MTRVVRTDFTGTFRKVDTTEQGGVRMPAALTRVGVFRYRDKAGREWGELRPPEEVFAPASLATLRAAPVVDLHPEKPVTAENYRALNLGHVHDDVAPEGGRFVVGTVTVQDAGEVKLILTGDRKEVSCGYSARVEPTPGVWEGERYDGIQRDIRYNHVGLGPEGWGRAGSEVSLRLDGAAVQVRGDAAPKGKDDPMKVLKIRGREYKLDAENEVAAAQGEVGAMEKKSDADTAALDALQKALQDALGQIAMWKAKAEAAASTAPTVTEENVPDDVADSLVTKRGELRARALRVLGETDEKGQPLKLDGKSAKEIRRMTVAKALPTLTLDSLSDERIEGMFLAVTAEGTATARNDSLASAHRAAHPHTDRTDGDDEGDLDPSAALARRTQTNFERRRQGGESEATR